MANETAILDFGSGKITVLIGERGVNGTISIKGKGERKYNGFMDGAWLIPEELPDAVADAIADAEADSGIKIERICVGVPAEFSAVVCKEVNLALNKRRKIKDTDIDELFELGDDFEGDDHEVINIQPVSFLLDDGRNVLQPVGEQSAKLGGVLSYVLAESSFTTYVRAIMEKLGVEISDFCSSVLAEALLLFDNEQRDNTAVLIDIGFITSSVSVVRGDGILSMNSFSRGGGYITADLTQAFDLSYSDAETLKQKIVLSINAADDEKYEIVGKDGIKSISAKNVNELASQRIKLIANAVEKCLDLCEYTYPDYIPYSLTGGGVSHIRGAKEIIGKEIGRTVEIIAPKLPLMNKPELSSALGLLDMAINDAPAPKGFFAKLFKK